jgi:hypothetical protein
VPTAITDRLGDLALGSHRINGNQRPIQIEYFEQQRDGGDLIGFLFRRLLSQHDPLTGGPGRDQVQGLARISHTSE